MEVREVTSVGELRAAGRVVGDAWLDAFDHILSNEVLEQVAEAQIENAEGVGTALLDACLDRAQGLDANRLVLETFTRNEHGRGFYEARGFEGVGESTFEIGGEEREAVVYARSL